MFFTFPVIARWNAERSAVEFGVEIGEYRGVVRVPRLPAAAPRAALPRKVRGSYSLQRPWVRERRGTETHPVTSDYTIETLHNSGLPQRI